MFYEFVKLVGGDINKYEDDGNLKIKNFKHYNILFSIGAWPVLIDEFVEFVKKRK